MPNNSGNKPQGPGTYRDKDSFELTLRGKHSTEHLPHEIPVRVSVEYRSGEDLDDEWWDWSVFFSEDVDGKVPWFEDEEIPEDLHEAYEDDIDYRVEEHIAATW